jgi:iron(III) transport system permease protein
MHDGAAVALRAPQAPAQFAGWLWALPVGALGFVVLYPLMALFATVFEHKAEALSILAMPRLLRVLSNTLQYTILTTVLALAVGLPLAWLLSRSEGQSTRIVRTLLVLSFVLPEFIYAIAYAFLLEPNTGYFTRLIHLIFADATPPLYGLIGMSIITGLYCVPQVVILVEPALRNISSDLEEAAETCGATTRATLFRVTLPLIVPSVLTATLLTVLLAFGSFGIPAALGIPVGYYVLSTEVFSIVSAYPPEFDKAAVLSLLFLLVGLLVALCQVYAVRKSIRYRSIGGKGFRRSRGRPSLLTRAGCHTFLWMCAALVSLLPLVIIFAASFAKKWWQIPGPLTLHHYEFVLGGDPLLFDVAWTTVSVTLLTVVGAIVLALALGTYSAARKGAAPGIIRLLGYVALSVPPIAFTIGALLAYVAPPLPLYGTVWILVFTYWARFYPLAAGPILDNIIQLDPALMESAQVAGANRWFTFWRVQLPLIRGAVIAGGLIVMMFTVRELLSAVFLQSSQIKMVMVSIYNYWDEGNLERATAMSSIVVFLCAFIFLIANRYQTGAAWRH